MRPLNLIFLLLLATASEFSFAQVESGADLSKSISVYPNPATDFLNIKFAVLNAHQTKLTLYNILGSEIPAETEVISNTELRVRVKELSIGYYLIAVRDEQTQFRGTYKFLKR